MEPPQLALVGSLQNPPFLLLMCRALMPWLSLLCYLLWSFCQALMPKIMPPLLRLQIWALYRHRLLRGLLSLLLYFYYFILYWGHYYFYFGGVRAFCQYFPFDCILLLSDLLLDNYSILFFLVNWWFISNFLSIFNFLVILEVFEMLVFSLIMIRGSIGSISMSWIVLMMSIVSSVCIARINQCDCTFEWSSGILCWLAAFWCKSCNEHRT